MFTYKGFSIWFNEITSKWQVQSGYEILGQYSTISGAKQSVTKKWSNT